MGLEDERMPDAFHVSANGDAWFLDVDPDASGPVVIHRANLASGGHETRMPVDAFLLDGRERPERAALIEALDNLQTREDPSMAEDTKTQSKKIAEEYLSLGGRRQAKVDDNIVSTRAWEDDTPEADAFWKEKVEPLSDEERREIELHLPSMSDT
jgi:hypothetical protein